MLEGLTAAEVAVINGDFGMANTCRVYGIVHKLMQVIFFCGGGVEGYSLALYSTKAITIFSL